MSNRLPTVTSQIPRDLRLFTDRVREQLGRDTPTRSEVTRLIRDGVSGGGGGSENPFGEIEIPHAPQNLKAEGGVGAIQLSWDAAVYTGHSYTEIWAGDNDNLSYAVAVGMSPGVAFAHAVPPEVGKFYWVRFVNANLKPGPYNAENGTFAKAKEFTLPFNYDTLAKELDESLLTKLLEERLDWKDVLKLRDEMTAYSAVLGEIEAEFTTITGADQWDATKTYNVGDMVSYKGGLYEAIIKNGPTINSPDINKARWKQIGSAKELKASIDETDNYARITLTTRVDQSDTKVSKISTALTQTKAFDVNAAGDIVSTYAGRMMLSRIDRAHEKADGSVADIKAMNKVIDSLKSTINAIEGDTVNAEALQALKTEVEAGRGGQKSLAEHFTALDTSITNKLGQKASASAFNTLKSTVESTTNGLATKASSESVRQLSASLGPLSKKSEPQVYAMMKENGVVWADKDGSGATYTLKLRAKDSSGEANVGFGLGAVKENGEWISDVRFDCRRFALFDSRNNLPAGQAKYPFIMKDGKVYIADLTVGTINIQSGAVTSAGYRDFYLDQGNRRSSGLSLDGVPPGAFVTLILNADVSALYGSTVQIQVSKLNWSKVFTVPVPPAPDGSVAPRFSGTVSFTFVDPSPTVGSEVYYVDLMNASVSTSCSGMLIATLAKR